MDLINLSLSTGYIPQAFNVAVIKLFLIKKLTDPTHRNGLFEEESSSCARARYLGQTVRIRHQDIELMNIKFSL